MANELSKFLSYLLRHKPEAKNIILDREGWASIDELILNAGFTRAELEEIVAEDKKSRYSISADGTKIRANQGHSTSSVKMTFAKAIPPTVLYHGTNSDVLANIVRQGLKPMKRHHVHLSEDVKTAEEVGGRRKKDTVILTIDAKQMLADGIQFYKSENGVWLVEYVDPRYFVV